MSVDRTKSEAHSGATRRPSRTISEGLTAAARQLRRKITLGFKTTVRIRFLGAGTTSSHKRTDLFRQPVANRIDDAARPRVGMTLIVLIPSA